MNKTITITITITVEQRSALALAIEDAIVKYTNRMESNPLFYQEQLTYLHELNTMLDEAIAE